MVNVEWESSLLSSKTVILHQGTGNPVAPHLDSLSLWVTSTLLQRLIYWFTLSKKGWQSILYPSCSIILPLVCIPNLCYFYKVSRKGLYESACVNPWILRLRQHLRCASLKLFCYSQHIISSPQGETSENIEFNTLIAVFVYSLA